MRLSITFIETMLPLIVMSMLTSASNIPSVVTETDEWIPYMPSPSQVNSTFWMENHIVYVKVRIEFNNTGYGVDWGDVVKEGYEIWVDSEIWMWTGVSLQFVTTLDYFYSLGELEQGTYTFTFKTWGSSARSTQFLISPEYELLLLDDLQEKYSSLKVELSNVRNWAYVTTLTTIIFIATTAYLILKKLKAKPS